MPTIDGVYELVASGRYVAREASESEADEQAGLTRLESGGFVFTWISNNVLKGYLIDANGSATGGIFYLNESEEDLPYNPSFAALPTGGFVASWEDPFQGVVVRMFDATGEATTSSIILADGPPLGRYQQPSVAVLSDGSFVVAFTIGDDGNANGIRAQLFDASGNKVGSEFNVNTVTLGNQFYPQTVSLSNGGFLVSWIDSWTDGYSAQFYDADGDPVGGQVSLATGDGGFDITTLASGNVVIVWPNANGELRGQIYDVAGAKIGGEFSINNPTEGAEILPEVAALASGGFAVTWRSPTDDGVNFFQNGDIHAQVFDANGASVGDEIVVASGELGQSEPHIVSFGSDDLFITYVEYDGFGNATIQKRAFYSAVQGSEGPDVLTGAADPDFIFGNGGDDQISGGDGDDNLYGGDGNDTLDGGGGANCLQGGAGNDSLTLGTGTDPFAWHSIAYGGTGADSITGSDGKDEIYSDVGENFDIGYSSFHPFFPEFYHLPTLDRGAEVDVITARAGGDFVSIGYGDSADGGATEPYSQGDELFLSLIASPTGLTIDFRNMTLNIGGGTITGFENVNYVEGTQFADTFIFSSSPFPIEGYGNPAGGGREVSGMGGDDHITAGYYTNNIWGGDGNDYLDGTASQYLLYIDGGAGNDTIIGAEKLVGGSGDDIVNGGTWVFGDDGNDTLDAGFGDDFLHGGTGNDSLTGGSGYDKMYGGTGNDSYYVNDATDFAYEVAGEGTDRVIASIDHQLRANIENLTLVGAAVTGKGNDLRNGIAGNANANKLYGYAGNDQLNGGAGDDMLYGDVGNDTLIGGTGYDRMYGGIGDDIYTVADTTDFAYELIGEGTDKVVASIDHQLRDNVENLELTGAAIVGKGNSLDNGISGNAGLNKLYGYDGNDVIDGAGGDDYVSGGAGNDTLTGGLGYDKMYGGTGDDIFIVNDSTDFAYENAGEGRDKVVSSVTHALRANVEDLELSGSGDIRGYGNGEHNLITGNGGANQLYGRDGNDTLRGNDGNDLLHGENGNDELDGGAGQDRYYGGSGADAFVFDDGDFAVPTPDRIIDFSQIEGDKIDLAAVDANSGLAGDQAFAFLGTAAFTGTAAELRSFQAGGVTYVEGDTNGDGTADFLVRIDGLHTLQASDFLM